jgi:hypothetical protein
VKVRYPFGCFAEFFRICVKRDLAAVVMKFGLTCSPRKYAGWRVRVYTRSRYRE